MSLFIRNMKLPMNPTVEQVDELTKWFEVTRDIWNKLLYYTMDTLDIKDILQMYDYFRDYILPQNPQYKEFPISTLEGVVFYFDIVYQKHKNNPKDNNAPLFKIPGKGQSVSIYENFKVDLLNGYLHTPITKDPILLVNRSTFEVPPLQNVIIFVKPNYPISPYVFKMIPE